MSKTQIFCFVCCAIGLSMKTSVIVAKYDNQPKIHTANGGLVLEAAYNRNITMRLSRDSSLLLNGVDIMEKIRQRYTPTTFDRGEAKPLNVPSTEQITNEVRSLHDDLDNLSRRFSLLQNRTRSSVQLGAIQRSLGRLRRLSGRLLALEQNVAKNECAESTDPCRNGGTCYDAYKGFHCECPEGWKGKTCEEDEDECYLLAGTDLGCQNNAICTNTLGGYKCACAKGYAGTHCRLRNTVCQQYQSEELCGHGICVPANNQQGYTCICQQGWASNTTAIANSTLSLACDVDVNECEESRNPCHSECINLPGTFKCGPCPSGYTGNGKTCIDIDECITNDGGCSLLPKVRCINTEGSYRCGNCPHGWIGDGHSCDLAPSNSCNAEKICHPLAKCEYISDIATCTCAHGMFGHGFGPDGCHTTPMSDSCENHICKNNGTCVLTGRGTSCLCPLGYSGSLCETADGCHPDPCENGGSCIPLANQSFKCSCNRGTTGKRCEVIRSVCGSIQRWTAGELSYPSDGAPEYASFERCAWIIRTSPSNILNLTFTSFDVQEDTECIHDWLQIHDGNSLASQLIGRFCGHELPLGGNIISSQHQLFFWFRSDNATNRPGFHMTWQSQPHICGDSLEFGAQDTGVIQSPGYPGKTPTNRECQWEFSAPYGYRLVIRIYEVNLGSLANCTGDSLKIYDADLLLKEFCKSQSPQPMRSSSNKVKVHFHTDSYGRDSSFQLHYEVEHSVPHCGGAFTDASGLIVGPTEEVVCLYLIQQPLGTQIQLEFLELEPFGVENCNLKSIEVFDGNTDEDSQLVAICNGMKPNPIVSSSNYMLIRYKNKLQTENHTPPFRAKYTRVCEFRYFGPEDGMFSTPNYPKPYTEQITCTFHIYGPAGTAVHANFTDFSIAETKSLRYQLNADETLQDLFNNQTTVADPLDDEYRTYVDVYLSDSYKRRYFKGDPMELISELNKMTIIFHATTNPIKARGIRVEYAFENINCGGVYTGPNGIFSNRFYINGDCKFIFEAPKGKDIRVFFNMLWNEGSAQVRIYGNGTGGTDYLLKNMSHVYYFDETFHFNVITIFSSSNVYLIGARYEFVDTKEGCGGNFSTLYGVIKSPGWPVSYTADLDCVWIVTAPVGNKIELTVQNFTLEPTCTGDILEVRNGMFSDSPLIGRYCGSEIPARIPSFTNSLYLRFTSDNSVEGLGFQITWEQSESGCGGKLTSYKGSIHSPFMDVDSGNSNAIITCDWNIHVARGSSVVINVMPSIDFLTFCRSNRLQIYDGATASKPLLNFNCTETQASGRITVTSSTNEVLVVYIPTSENSRDFILDYETNCKMMLDHVQGVIESPNFPELYPDLLNCNWDIRAGVNNKLKLAFSHLSLEADNMECEYDYVEVLDMKNEDLLQKYHLCTDIPAPITSEGNRLVIKFVTDYSTGKNGFRAEYSREGCGSFLASEFGTIQPPNYPYSIDLDCDWYIEVPAGRQIVFSVFELKIETDNPDCSEDVLLIKESKNASHTMLKECSTQQMPSMLTSPANKLYLNFHTGPSRVRKYFKALYHTKEASCGGVFRGSSGIINSPNYPQNLTQEFHCKWEINVPESYGIVIKFNDFEISASRNCSEAYLRFSTLSGQTETVLQQYCGSELPDMSPVRSGRLSIEYMSKGTQSSGRFSIEFKKQCGDVITDGSGFIRSHAGEECLWLFNVTAGSLISLNILQLDCYCSKEDLKASACTHFLGFLGDISDTETSHNNSMIFCEDHRSNLVFEKSILHIMAHKINFRAKYSTTQHSCGGAISSARGSLASPYYPATYPPNVECTWFLRAAQGNNIQLQVVEMDIAKSDHCNEDYLEIRTMSTNKILGIYCGNEVPDDVPTSFEATWIRFHSSAGNTGKGFKLSWSYAHLNEFENITQGVIESPPIAMARSEEEPFAWRILVERDNYISLTFDNYIDGLSLYDGFDDTALPVAMSASPWRFVSSTNVVFLKTDNDRLQYFYIKWNITNTKVIDTNANISKCQSELFVKSQSYTYVTSPGYPYGYEPNLQCQWIFKAVNAIEHVVCEVNVVKLEVTHSCSADYLKISTSTDLTQWHEMKKLCNSSDVSFKPFLVFHGTPHIKLDFVSDATVNRTGFSAKIRTKCGSNLTESVGFINGDLLMYGSECLWQILVKQTKRIRLQLDFAPTVVGNVNDCLEYALIYDGMDEHAPLMPPGKICNPQNVSRLLFNSTSNYLTIKYNLTMGRPNLPNRWNLTYREYSDCNEEYRLLPEAAAINVTSPNYPNIPHPHTECEWRIVAPRGELIQVEFVDRFDMNSRFCSLEFLEMFDGSTSLARSMGRFCRKPPILKTTQNILYLRYQTDTREPRSGFRARISISKCGGSYSDANGLIVSPGYPNPGSYPSSTQCDYVINMPMDSTMHLVATDIHLPFNSINPKTSDYLEIIPIADDLTTPQPIFVYGNTTKGSFFDLNVNKAIVRFHTFGKNTEYRGFSLKYNRFGGQCVQDVSGDTGLLTMHFPKRAYFSSFCRWKITVPKGQRVRLEFLNLNDLKEQNSTRYPNFAIYNDHDLLSKLTSFDVNSFDPSAVIQSSDNRMLVRIHIPIVEFQFKTIRARYTSDEISPCPADIGDDNQSGLIDILDTQPLFNGNYYCSIKIKLSGDETLVFNITSFENTRNSTAPKLQSPLVFRDNIITTSYWENLTLALQPHTQVVGYVRILQSGQEHIRRLRMDYRRHKCGGYYSVISNIDFQQPAAGYFGYGPIMCVWTLAKPFWTGRVDSEFQLSGNFTFTDSCDREFLLIREGQWKGNEPSKKICRDNGEQLQSYTFTHRLTYLIYQSQHYNPEKSHFSMQIRKSIVCGSEVKVTQISSTVEVKKDSYKNNQECSWVFFTTPGLYLQLHFFDRFFIEDSPNCTNDHLEIQRYEDGLWFPEARFCGRIFPDSFNASTTRMRVLWHTNDAVTADGFSFFVRIHCSVTLNVTSEVQQIVSPTGFSYGGRRLQCQYIFQSNETDKLINVRTRLASGSYYGSSLCRSGGFLFYKRDENGAEQMMERHCELEFEERAFKYLKVNYDSSLMVKYTIEFAFDTCGGNITTSPTTIRPLKHEHNNLYADNMNCVWLVMAPADHSIAIRFKYFDTEKNFDHVSIYSGTKIQTDHRQAKLSGNLTENPPIIVVDHNQAVINAVSDASSSNRGFEAQIVFIPNCNERIAITDGNSPVILARTFRLNGEGEYMCIYRVTAPKGHRIRIDIKKLLINNSTSQCVSTESKCERHCNAIETFDSASTEQASMGRFCMAPRTNTSLMSSYEDAMLKFDMKISGQYSMEIILTMEKSVCGDITEYKLGENEIFKFSFPQNGEPSYAPNVHCTWRVRADYWMQLHFNYIDLQNKSQVTGKCVDYIEIKGTQSSNQFCGHATNYATSVEKLYNTGIDITFHSDATVQGKGFELEIDRRGACNRTYNQLSGIIRYEEGNSPQQGACNDTIVVPENYTLNLYVPNMYFTNYYCEKLHFRITDLKSNKTLLDRCHSSYVNVDLFTSTNAVRLEATDYTSLTIFYTVSEVGATPGCGATIQASEGYLSNPSYENDRNFSECRWDIIVPAPNIITLYFYAFNMGSSTNCPLDNVKVIDILPGGTEKMMKTLCGAESQSFLSSTSNHIAVISKKSPNFDGTGWNLQFQMERIYNT